MGVSYISILPDYHYFDYDLAIGRFISVDPVDVSTSSGSNFNRYTDQDGRENIGIRQMERDIQNVSKRIYPVLRKISQKEIKICKHQPAKKPRLTLKMKFLVECQDEKPVTKKLWMLQVKLRQRLRKLTIQRVKLFM